MIQIGTESQFEAARHEAGHVVIGVRSGSVVTDMHIRCENGRWLGDSKFANGKVSADDMMACAIAGCLAQAKSVAESQCSGTVAFDMKCDLKPLIHIVRDSDRSGPDSDPGSCDVFFLADGKRLSIHFDGAWFSGADASGYRLGRKSHPPFDSVDTQLIRSVMDELDDAKNWRALCAVSDELCRRTVADGGTCVLSGDDIRKAMSEADSEHGEVPGAGK